MNPLQRRVATLEHNSNREPLCIVIRGALPDTDPMDVARAGTATWQREQAEASAAFQARVIADAKARRARAVVFGGLTG